MKAKKFFSQNNFKSKYRPLKINLENYSALQSKWLRAKIAVESLKKNIFRFSKRAGYSITRTTIFVKQSFQNSASKGSKI